MGKRGTAPPAAKITLKMMAPTSGYYGPWEEYRIFKAIEEQTNIHFEFDLAAEGFQEKKNLALATGDLPDIFFRALNIHDEETYGPQGEIIVLNDLIDKQGPNIKKALAKYPLLKKAITASDKNIYALGQITYTQTQGSYKMCINAEWLKNLGLSKPETIDDFYRVLRAFKDNDPNRNGKADEEGMTCRGFLRLNGVLMTAFGETYGGGHGKLVSLKNDVVTFTPLTEGFKVFIEFLNKLYTEKLLDNEFISHSTEEYIAKTKSMRYGVLGHPSQADWTKFDVLAPMTSAYSSEKMATALNHIETGRFAITRVNKHPVESIKWADLFHRHYTDSVNGLSGVSFWLGQQGVDWDYVEGEDAVNYILEPEGDLSHWLTFLKRIGPGGGTGVRIMDKPFAGAYQGWVAAGNVKYAFPYQKDERLYPGAIRFTSTESERLSILQTDIQTYIDQMEAKFVVGQESFDTLEKYVATLNKMHVDEYVKILQAGYDRYNK
jgi:putative aldouronate transport system substrate-binding protein